MSFDKIQASAQAMIENDGERDVAFEAYEKMYHNLWDLPESVKELPWVARIIDSSPFDAINTGVRLLAALPFSVEYQPLAPGTANKKRANNIETILKWQVRSANRRRSKSIEADIVLSALLYDAVATEVIDLDWAIANKEAANADPAREKAIRQVSRFMVKTHSPRNVHVRTSGFFTEALLSVEVMRAQEVIDEWGDVALAIPELTYRSERPRGDDWVTRFDYWDYSRRAVWLAPGVVSSVPQAVQASDMILVPESDNPFPFLPWVANMGGTTLEASTLHKYKPILYPVYMTGAWDMLNLVESMLVSETVAHSGSPRYAEQGTNPQQGEVDYMSPDRIAKMPPGNELVPLQPPGIDAALSQVDALLSAKIDKQTVSRILQGGDLPSGIAFATMNLATQTAVGVLKTAKDLSEKSLSEVMTIMLLWSKYTGKPLLGYATDKETKGTQLIIKPKEIVPEAIYLDAKLHPDDALDRQSRISTAALAVRELNVSLEDALEQAGWSDPQKVLKERTKERIFEHVLTMRFRKDLMEMEAATQMKITAAQMKMQEQMQARQTQLQAQLQQLQGQGGGMPGMPGLPGGGSMGAPPMAGPSVDEGYTDEAAFIASRGAGVRGQAVNTGGGGESPVAFNPADVGNLTNGEDILGESPGGM